MTNTLKYSSGVFFVIVLLFFYNKSSQSSYDLKSKPIFDGKRESVFRILITEHDDYVELVRKDTTWSITQELTYKVKDNQIDKIFNRLLKVEQEMLITTKSEKWEKFGVDDSLGRHIQVFDENDNEIIHYVFGNSGQDWQHNYIRESRSNDVYRTNDNVYFLLNSNTTYWGEKPPEEKTENDND